MWFSSKNHILILFSMPFLWDRDVFPWLSVSFPSFAPLPLEMFCFFCQLWGQLLDQLLGQLGVNRFSLDAGISEWLNYGIVVFPEKILLLQA